jgi:hypothetical protein
VLKDIGVEHVVVGGKENPAAVGRKPDFLPAFEKSGQELLERSLLLVSGGDPIVCPVHFFSSCQGGSGHGPENRLKDWREGDFPFFIRSVVPGCRCFSGMAVSL